MVKTALRNIFPPPDVWEIPRNAGRFTSLTAFPGDWGSYRDFLRKALAERMGLDYGRPLPPECRVIRETEYDGCLVRTLVYRTRPDVHTTATLYVPKGKGPFPAVINLHGHWPEGRLAARVQSRGFALAKRGYVVLSPDAFGLGERSTVHTRYEHHGRTLGAAVFNLGETMMGCLLADNMRGVDLLASLPEVDPERIGATGASGGGNQTMWLAAMDDRVKAAVPVCSVGSFESYLGEPNCVCETLPGGLEVTEMAGVLALAAPRAMMICTGLYDVKTFSPGEMLRSFDAAKPIYAKLGAADRFSCRILNQGHAYSKEAREVMLGWFDLHLKGEGNGLPQPEPDYRTLEPETLLAFEPGKRPPEVSSVAEYCRRKGTALREKLREREGFDSAEEVEKLAETLKIRPLLRVDEATEIAPAGKWRRFQLRLTDGRFLPLTLLPGPGKVILFTHVSGKHGIPAAVLDEAAAQGAALALADLSGHGENQPEPDAVRPYHQYARSLLWLGHTLCGEWTSELAALAGFLTERFPERTLALHGFRETAVASLYASLVRPEIREVILEDAPVSYVFQEQNEFFGMALPVPGILKWGDIPLAAALSDAEISWIDPRDSAGNSVPPPDKEVEFFRNKIQQPNRKGRNRTC